MHVNNEVFPGSKGRDLLSCSVLNLCLDFQWVNRCVFSPNGQYLASTSGDVTARLWSTTNFECVHVLEGNGTLNMQSVLPWKGRLLTMRDGERVGGCYAVRMCPVLLALSMAS